MTESDPLFKAMSLLCVKNKKPVVHDTHWVGFDKRGKQICLLCGDQVEGYSDDDVKETKRQHAIKHLKEHKLLAFL